MSHQPVPAAAESPIDLYDLTRPDLIELLDRWGFSRYHADRLWKSLYRRGTASLADLDDLRPDLLAQLAARARLTGLATREVAHSRDGYTRKYLLALADGLAIETVIMRFTGRYTACVSTQVGCAMGCVFCATGQMGFFRHLSAGEVVAQVLHVQRTLAAAGEDLRNIVLMGMGEPLHNVEATLRAVDILCDDHGLAFAPRHITLSTVGVVPGIRRLADDGPPINLAVSLHAASDEERAALVPPARRWPLAELIAACHYYVARRRRRIFFEWALIAGQNDDRRQAHAVGRLLQGLRAHVNLIPLNPTAGFDGRPSDLAAARRFQAVLAQYDLPSTVRQRRGIDVAAGCGQLAGSAPMAGPELTRLEDGSSPTGRSPA